MQRSCVEYGGRQTPLGRNYDFDRLAEGSGMTFLPRGTSYFGVNGPDGTAFPCTSRYACAGMG